MSRGRPRPPTDPSAAQGRNEYIPNFISRKPFYIDDSTLSDADYLEHQRLQSLPQDTLSKSKWYDRGRKLGQAATKFRKGACENCGAMTHKTKECLSRPRKEGAKWTGKNIQADEMVEDVKLGWDAKRDRWNGYDAREYSAVIKEYEELEALKKAATTSNGRRPKISGGKDEDENGDEAAADNPDIESAKYGEETDMGRSQPTSTRNLRIREDTAKYLMNLDLDSAKYDPKTRSMAANVPNKDDSNNDQTDVADENFTRPSATSNDAAAFQRAQRYAWETQERLSTDNSRKKLHLQANPTEGEILLKKQTAETTAKKQASRQALLDKYGGAEHLQPTNPNSTQTSTTAPTSTFRAAENDRYVEYDKDGNIIKSSTAAAEAAAQNTTIPISKYAEDVLLNNHTAIWGSWWHSRNFAWGYKCCHSTVKNSYCTGEEGKRAFEEADRITVGHLVGDGQMPSLGAEEEEQEQEQEKGNPGEKKYQDSRIPVKEADEKRGKEDLVTDSRTGKKRPFQSPHLGGGRRDEVTEEELELYKRRKTAADDPMAAFLTKVA